jgi:hypothetical protein
MFAFTLLSPHIFQSLAGVEIVTNGSGSHHQLRKLDSRLSLMRSAMSKCGGCYLYANHRGPDKRHIDSFLTCFELLKLVNYRHKLQRYLKDDICLSFKNIRLFTFSLLIILLVIFFVSLSINQLIN